MKTLLLSICLLVMPHLLYAGINEDIDKTYGIQSISSNCIKRQVAELGSNKVKLFWLNANIKELSDRINHFSDSFPFFFERMSFHLPQANFQTSSLALSYWLQKKEEKVSMLENYYQSNLLTNILDIIILITPSLDKQHGQLTASSLLNYWSDQMEKRTPEAIKLNQLAGSSFYCGLQVALQAYFNQEISSDLINFWSNHHNFLTQLNSPSDNVIQTLIVLLPLVDQSQQLEIMQWLKSKINRQFSVQQLLTHPIFHQLLCCKPRSA